jgi:hypothetical protein
VNTVGEFAWLIMLVWLIFGGVSVFSVPVVAGQRDPRVYGFGSHILIWLLVACFVYHDFGFPLH